MTSVPTSIHVRTLVKCFVRDWRFINDVRYVTIPIGSEGVLVSQYMSQLHTLVSEVLLDCGGTLHLGLTAFEEFYPDEE